VTSSTGTADPAELLAIAVDVATQAGLFLVRDRPPGALETRTKTSPTDPVTVMDTGSERLIVDALRAVRPDDAVLGEEGGERPGRSGVRWLVDPIDGTVNYEYRLPHWSVSVAAEVDGVVVAGAVNDPAIGEVWTAIRGGGSWRNGEQLQCSTETRLEHALIGTGFGYTLPMRTKQAEVIRSVLPQVRDIRRVGSCAVDLCWTAAGRFDAFFEHGPNIYDFAAGGLVASEAGVRFGGLRGRPASPAMILAAPPALFGPLHDLLVTLRADEE
jgi:myo-inositol-1(or 4)-monophosphatase